MINTTAEGIKLFDNLTNPKSNQNHSQNLVSRRCSGKGCTKIANNLLLISYINKRGYFCDDCTCDLLTRQLALRIRGV